MTTQAPEGAAGGAAPPPAGAPPAGGTPPPAGGGFRGSATGQPFGAPPAGDAPPAGRPRTELVIPPVPLADRLKRAGKTAAEAANRRWAQALGADDPAKVAERLKKLDDLEKADAERQQATMTEVQRLQAEREAEKNRADQLEGQLREAQENAAYQRQDQQLREIASEYVDPKAVRFARHEWANYVVGLTAEEQEKLSPRDAKKWFQRFAQDNPQFAKGTGAPPPADAPPAQRPGAPPARRPAPPPNAARKPINNGPPPAKRDPAAGAAPAAGDSTTDGGKTARPGQKNSMNRAELKEFARKHGVNYPG